MKSQHKTEFHTRWAQRRGVVAVTELVVVVGVLTALFLLGTQLFFHLSQESASSGHLSKAVSTRTVHHLSLNREGDRLWVYRPREQLVQVDLSDGSVCQSIPFAASELITIAHSADGNSSVLGTVDGFAYLCRNGDEACKCMKVGGPDTQIDAAISADGSISVCVATRGKVRGWFSDSQSPQEFGYALPDGADILKIGLNPSGQQMTVARADGSITFHETTTGLTMRPPLKLDADCSKFAWSRDEKFLALASGGGFTRVYEMSHRTIIASFDLRKSECSDRPTAIAISPDCRWLAVSTNTMQGIFIGSIQTGEQGRLLGHDGIVCSLEFSPGSDRLYSGSYDGTIREWSPATRQQIRIID